MWPDEEGRSEDDDEGRDLQSDSEERLPSENDDASGDVLAESDATEGLRAGHTSHHEDENEAAASEATEGWTVMPEAEAQ